MDFRNRQKAGAKITQKNMGKSEGGLCTPEVIFWGSGFLIKSALRCIDIAVDVCENFCKTCENHKKHGNMLSIHVNKRLKIGDIR